MPRKKRAHGGKPPWFFWRFFGQPRSLLPTPCALGISYLGSPGPVAGPGVSGGSRSRHLVEGIMMVEML